MRIAGSLRNTARLSILVSLLLVGPSLVAGATPIAMENIREISEMLDWSTQGVPVFDLAYSSDGTQLYGVHGNVVAVWDPASGQPLNSWSAHPGFAAGLALSPDGTQLATVGSDSILKVWDIATGDLVRSLSPAGTHAVVFSPDGSLIASGGRTGVLRLWRVESGELVHEIDTVSRMFSVAFSLDGDLLATAHGLPDFAVRVWSSQTGELVWESFEHGADAHVIAFSPNGGMIASVGADAQVILWDAASGEALRILRRESTPLFELLFISDELIATGDGNGTIRFWKTQTGQLMLTRPVFRSEVSALALSPDGSQLATASFDMQVALFGVPEE
ncbi:WD40 repeat domain-containing protein [Candidatus Bipolaricaulota bacterium]